jgi:aminoglycoside/choline kinase family phosphotransferase
MKPEQSERFLIEELFSQSKNKKTIPDDELTLIDKLTGDASTRRYYRLFTNVNSYVVCLDNPSEDPNAKHPFVSIQEFFDNNKIKVPRIYDKNLSKGYLLEEDLGDITLLQHLSKIKTEADEYKIYEPVIAELIKLHSIAPQTLVDSNLFSLKFDFQKLFDEMNFTFKYFINNWLKVDDVNVTEKLRRQVIPICERLSSFPMVLTHRDFHSRNIMVKNDQFYFIDFQDARMGIPQYDLVSILEDCYYNLSEQNRSSLKKFYYNNLESSVHGQSEELFWDLYDDMTFQRVFKAIGSFSYIYCTRKDERYLKYIGFAMEKLRVMMLGKPRYDELRKTLLEIYYAS